MRELPPIFDGDQGPIYRFTLQDGAAVRDLASAAAMAYIEDDDGTLIATRPCHIIQAKSTGQVDVLLKGAETDYAGLGKNLVMSLRCYYAQAMDGRTPATNLLVNPSFDTYTGGTGVADSWAASGTLDTMTYEVRQDDPSPPVIFGMCQRAFETVAGGSTSFLTQSPSVTLVPGDVLSGGVWYRAWKTSGAALAVGAALYLRINGGRPEEATTNFPTSDSGWVFVTAESLLLNAYATGGLNLVNFGAKGYEVRYDDAFLFKGRWTVFQTERKRLPVTPKAVPAKELVGLIHPLSGFGDFEEDSNADGIGDAWGRTGSGNTYSIETDPDEVSAVFGGVKAQKVVLSGSTTERLRIIVPGKYLTGETWRAQLLYKNSGALSGSPANGDFGLVLHTEEFDGAYEESSLPGANFSLSSISSYATKFRTLTLTADHSALVIDINLKTASGGTLWLDDIALFKT